MKIIVIILIIAAAYALFVFFGKFILCVFDRQLRRKEHYQRRKEQRRRQLERNQYYFLLNLAKQQQIQQEKQESKQTIAYKGYFSNSRILRIWYTDRPSDWYYIYQPDIDTQIQRLIQTYSDKPNVEAITLECEPYLIPLIDKSKEETK